MCPGNSPIFSFFQTRFMAEQKGIFPLKGTIGNVTFYKTKDGYLAREKGGLDASRIANDPAFQRTRENGAEFGRAGKAGKVIRTAYRPLLQHIADGRMIARLTRGLMQVIKADTVNPRGERTVTDGNLLLLQGFEFNANSKLGATLYAPYSQTVVRASGQLSVALDPFVPSSLVTAPSGTTHFKITSAGAELDFATGTAIAQINATAELPWDSSNTAAISLVNNVTPNSSKPLLLAMGIEFYQQVNGTMYPLKNGAFNALALVAVSVA
jgi:hypothetical protein